MIDDATYEEVWYGIIGRTDQISDPLTWDQIDRAERWADLNGPGFIADSEEHCRLALGAFRRMVNT